MKPDLLDHEEAAVKRVAAIYQRAGEAARAAQRAACGNGGHIPGHELVLTIAANMLTAADAAQPPTQASDDAEPDNTAVTDEDVDYVNVVVAQKAEFRKDK